MARGRICRLSVHNLRFPTSLGGHGSDPTHTGPDCPAAYVVIMTDSEDGLKGYGIVFTLRKDPGIVVDAVNALTHYVLQKDLRDIVGDLRGFCREITSDGQLRLCHNRMMIKQLLHKKALQFLQIDSCKLRSVNENLAVLLMAKVWKDDVEAVDQISTLLPLAFRTHGMHFYSTEMKNL